ncbi:hypothetical protein MNBD_GAMMA16-679 [hydrothermal vent metagenome]|uniref:Type IV fimbrial biogenesis protein PilW n=1 Tax=hydrothermal vent metagenome TaxID=652676 RepID=A0A3B0ZGX2_9ZZZZ
MNMIILIPVKMKKMQGLSLIELMVATTIGLLLTSAIIGLFASSKRAHSDSMDRGIMYENGRYAISVLSNELRLTEFWGETRASDIVNSAGLNAIVSDCTGNAAGYDIGNSLWGLTTASATITTCITDAKTGTDAFVIKHVAATPTLVASLESTRTYLMANEFLGVLFDGADTPPSTVPGGDVPGGQAWEYTSTLYYIREQSGEVPALYRKKLTGNTWGASEEIANGIENMRLLYGVDTDLDGVADKYDNATAASWANVVAARVYLLMRSEKASSFSPDTKTYLLGDVTVDPSPDDNYYRLVFNTSVNLRNRKLAVLAEGS